MLYKLNETVFGSRTLTTCPICGSENIKNIFRIPYRKLEEYIPYRNCSQAYVSTYDYEIIYKWDACNDCQTLFMNPIEPFTKESRRDDAVKLAKTDYQMTSYAYRIDEVQPYVKRFGTLLEIGCGGGQVLKLFKHRMKEFGEPWSRIIGVEVNHTTVDYLKEQGFEAYCRPFEEGLPEVENGTVDCVLMHEVIEHLDNPHTCFCHIAKLLRKGGVFAMSAQMQGGKLFLRPNENVCTNLQALSDTLGRLGINIIYHTENAGKIRIIGEKI
jgi:SAM-dependent methyltransferase